MRCRAKAVDPALAISRRSCRRVRVADVQAKDLVPAADDPMPADPDNPAIGPATSVGRAGQVTGPATSGDLVSLETGQATSVDLGNLVIGPATLADRVDQVISAKAAAAI